MMNDRWRSNIVFVSFKAQGGTNRMSPVQVIIPGSTVPSVRHSPNSQHSNLWVLTRKSRLGLHLFNMSLLQARLEGYLLLWAQKMAKSSKVSTHSLVEFINGMDYVNLGVRLYRSFSKCFCTVIFTECH